MSQLSLEQRIALITSITEHGGELIGANELPEVLQSSEQLYTYDGFEPSGQMHIAQGIIRAINVNKMIDAGFIFRMWVADWFAFLNNKLGGDLEKIQTVGKYFIEVWKASGMNVEKTEFLWTSDFVGQRWYWELVMKVAKAVTLKRALRTTAIMGRNESDDLSAGQILYPCMQAADIFGVMKARVTQLGLDQQKVNVLAREIGEELGYWKPVIVSHGMLQGLQKPVEKKMTLFQREDILNNAKVPFYTSEKKIGLDAEKLETDVDTFQINFVNANNDILRTITVSPQMTVEKYFDLEVDMPEPGTIRVTENTQDRTISMKMSKSKPDTAIFMTDTDEEVQRKITKAYCPEGVAEDNPVLDYCKQIIFNAKYLKRETPLLENDLFVISRKPEHGGDISFTSYAELEAAYVNKEVFPLDLKNAVVTYLNALLQPVRDHFENDAEAKALLEQVRSFEVTR
ncbi:MAG: hypothetical protein QY312_02475 [Candidatus Dojkabacteria bacterium]|nr:MAG: hypothetical protein QY312_02475 [Candidatus Dojkabacteria bacterium]